MKDALSTVVSLLTLLLRPVAMSAYDGGDRSAGAGETLMLLTSRTWETFNTDLPPLQDVAQGNSMIAALTTDGEAYILRRHWSDKLAASPGTATLFAKGVSSLHGNEFALLALADDGRVLPFKDYESWSPSSLTRGRVLSLVSTERAFAALLNDTSVVAWGYHDWGGDTSAVADEISGGVTALYAMQYGFLAVKVDGTVVTWGWDPMAMEACDLKLPPPQMTSTNFISVHDEFHGQIVALAEDGTMYNWGCVEHAWAPPGTTVQLEFQTLGGVISVARTSNSGFAALRQDGSVTTWGLGWYNWINSIELASELATGVKSVHGNDGAFAALKGDGSVITWGDPGTGGSWPDMVGLEASYDAHHYLDVIFSWDVAEELASDVEEIISTPAGYSFAALKADGSVVVWGKSEGSDIEAMETQLSGGVSAVFTTGGVGSYAALKEDGSAVTWGLYIKQSSSSSGDVYMLGSNISNIFPLPSGFVVTKAPRAPSDQKSVLLFASPASRGCGAVPTTKPCTATA